MRFMAMFFSVYHAVGFSYGVLSANQQKHTSLTMIPKFTILNQENKIETFNIALKFQMEDKWHIYWKNPGEIGKPPAIDVISPSGAAIEEIKWPVPVKIYQDDIVTYGYTKESVLLLSVKLPQPTIITKIKAQIRWLECAHVCLTQKENIEADILLGNTNQTNKEFDTIVKENQHLYPIRDDTLLKAKAYVDKSNYILKVLANRHEKVDFYPYDSDLVVPTDVSKPEKNGFFRLSWDHDNSSGGLEHMKGYLVYDQTSQTNFAGAYLVDIPIIEDRSMERIIQLLVVLFTMFGVLYYFWFSYYRDKDKNTGYV